MSAKIRGLNRSGKSFCLGLFSILLVAVPGGYWTLKAQDTQSTATDTAAKSTKKKRSKKATSDTSTAAADTAQSTSSATQTSTRTHKSRKSATASGTEAPASQPAAASTPPATAASSRSNANTTPRTAPPSGSGMVWVNTETKVYHREGDRWYGKTKQGKYMNESDAVKAGYHLAGSKSNQQ